MFRLREFKFLYPLLREELRAYLFGTGLIVLTTLFQVAIPYVIGEAIGFLEFGSDIDLVPYLALVMLGAVLLRGLTAFYMRRVMIGASRRAARPSC